MRSKKILSADMTPAPEEEIFEDFKVDMTDLKPEVRKKAIELAKEMVTEACRMIWLSKKESKKQKLGS